MAGYFSGGALLRCFDGDGMLMQKLLRQPAFDSIQPCFDYSQQPAPAAVVKRDRERCPADPRGSTG